MDLGVSIQHFLMQHPTIHIKHVDVNTATVFRQNLLMMEEQVDVNVSDAEQLHHAQVIMCVEAQERRALTFMS